MKPLITTLTALAIATSLSSAQTKPATGPHGQGKPPSPEQIFKKLDTNGDGFLSLAEFKARPKAQENPARAEAVFKKIDTNGDGKISLDELKAFRATPRPGVRGKGGQHKPAGTTTTAPVE